MLARYFPERPIEVIAHGAALAVAGLRRERSSACRRAFDCPTTACRRSPSSAPSVPTRARAGSSGWSSACARDGVRVRFVLIGYLDAEHGPWQADEHVHRARPLRAARASGLLRALPRAAGAYPSAGPETFSFTLSEAGPRASRSSCRRSARWPSACAAAVPAGCGPTQNGATRGDARAARRARRSRDSDALAAAPRARGRVARDARGDAGRDARAVRRVRCSPRTLGARRFRLDARARCARLRRVAPPRRPIVAGATLPSTQPRRFRRALRRARALALRRYALPGAPSHRLTPATLRDALKSRLS